MASAAEILDHLLRNYASTTIDLWISASKKTALNDLVAFIDTLPLPLTAQVADIRERAFVMVGMI